MVPKPLVAPSILEVLPLLQSDTKLFICKLANLVEMLERQIKLRVIKLTKDLEAERLDHLVNHILVVGGVCEAALVAFSASSSSSIV